MIVAVDKKPTVDKDSLIVKLCFYGFTLSLPFIGWSLVNIGDSIGLDFSYIFGAAIITLGCLYIFVRKIEVDVYSIHLITLLLLTILISILGSTTNYYFSLEQYTKSLIHSCFFYFLFFSIASLKIKSDFLKRVFYLILILSLVVSIYGIYQFFARLYGLPFSTLEFTSATQGIHVEAIFLGIPRISSFFSEPSWFAQYMLKSVIIILVFLSNSNFRGVFGQFKFNYFFILLFLYLVSIILSFSLAAVGIAFAALILLLLQQKRLKLTLVLFLSTVLISVTNSYFFEQSSFINPLDVATERVTGVLTGQQIEGESLGNRSNELSLGFELFMKSPIWGIGHGQSASFVNQTTTLNSNGISNYYLLLLSEQGILGILSFCGFSFLLFSRLLKTRSYLQKNEMVIFYILIYTLLVDFFFLNSIGNFYSTKYWFDFGMAASFSARYVR